MQSSWDVVLTAVALDMANCPQAAGISAPPRTGVLRWTCVSLCALAIVILSSLSSTAQEKRRTTTDGGIPLDEIILVRMGGSLFRIPAGYMWPGPEKRHRVNDQPALSFHFWMPDRRYVERASLTHSGWPRPKEAGRDPAPDEAYIVSVGLRSVTLDTPGYRSPEAGFRNRTSYRGASYVFREEFGLIRYWQRDTAPDVPEVEKNYRHREGTDPQVFLRCTPAKGDYPSGCQGDIHFVSDDIGLFIHFPGEKLPEWSQIVFAARDFYRSWKAGP